MRIETLTGDLPFRTFTFPDGQQHFVLEAGPDGGHDGVATIHASLRGIDDVFDVLLAKDVLDLAGFVTHLNIYYLYAARMDRRISAREPATLTVVARLLNAAGFRRVRILDPHSAVSLALLGAEAVYPTGPLAQVLAGYDPLTTVLVAPDAGATPRVQLLLAGVRQQALWTVVQGQKTRNPVTGALSGFAVQEPHRVAGKHCLILDDICDGGGTFTGLSAELRAAKATDVDLFVTHGIFSKGTPIPGITKLYATDSYPGCTTGVVRFSFVMGR